VIVATSTDPSDAPIADFCEEIRTPCFRGSLTNVADRLRQAADVFCLDAFVRLSADSPLLDISIVQRCVERFVLSSCDLATNVFPRSFPRGQSAEVIRTSSLQHAFDMMAEPEDFEHVTRLFYRTPRMFHIENVVSPVSYGSMHLAVDSREDFAAVEAIVGVMDRPHWEYGLDEIAQLHRSETKAASRR
jgi:spore coat polysaccharide biosynthesis protein SpsF (cytidylyltransferase family)